MNITSLFRILFLLLIPVMADAAGSMAVGNPEKMLAGLDVSLQRKDQYEKRKLKKIDGLKGRLHAVSGEKRYDVLRQLYHRYSSYQYDSAYVYARQMGHMAQRLHSVDYAVESQCAVVFCLLSAGLYNEASDAFDAIDCRAASAPYRKIYYTTAVRFYYDMADFTHAEPYMDRYIRQGNAYTDSLLTYLHKGSIDWWYAVGMRQMKQRRYDACMKSFQALLNLKDVDTHTKAIVTSSMGWVCLFKRQDDRAVCYLAQAALYDNEAVTRETTALCTLARLLYRQGDIRRATEYVRQSLENANFYGARQRVIEVSSILPIIEHDRYQMVEHQRNALATTAVIAVLFVLALLLFTWFIRRQMKKIKQAQAVIAERKAQLEQKNALLQEVNKIKDEYIGQSFYANAEYINKVEKLYRTIDRKIADHRYDDLRMSLKESELIAERKSMFADFDKTFLNLFPTFIEQYNRLFADTGGKSVEKGKSLTTEMRIFALIRLGITDSERIAKFLNYSIHTINTYKTRVKNKSIVDNDQFEAKIMEI